MTSGCVKNICRVVVPTIYRENCPTVHSRLLPLCKRLADRGFEFTFLLLDAETRKICPGVVYEGYASYPQLIFKLVKTSRIKADVLFASKPYTITGLLSFVVAKVRGLGFLLDVDDRVFPSHIRKWWRLPLYIQEWLAERLLAWFRPATSVASRALQDYIGKHTVYIPNSAELDRFSTSQNEAGYARVNSPKVVVWPAVFFQETDRRYIIDIYRDVLDMDDKIQLLVVGDGECLPDIKAYAVKRGAWNTKFVGRVPYEEMPGYYARAGAGILPLRETHYDSCKGPIKLYEFMAMGLPVIATDIGEPAEMIKLSGCGVILPFRNSRLAAEKIVDFMGNQVALNKAGAAGRKYLEENHNFDLFANDFEKQLRTVV